MKSPKIFELPPPSYTLNQKKQQVGKYTSPMDPKTMKNEGFKPPVTGGYNP